MRQSGRVAEGAARQKRQRGVWLPGVRLFTAQRAVLVTALLLPTVAGAQVPRPGIALHVGTTGIGADFALGVHKHLGFRAGGSFFPFDFNITESDIDYSLSFPSPQFLLAVDVYAAGPFRFTGGLVIQQDDFGLEATPAEPVEIGGVLYSPTEIGSLTGVLDTRAASPYLGLGFGTPNTRGVGFFLDLGVAFHGEPAVSVTASGPIASVPQFQQDLAEEVADIQDEVSSFKVLPVARIGLMIGFGR